MRRLAGLLYYLLFQKKSGSSHSRAKSRDGARSSPPMIEQDVFSLHQSRTRFIDSAFFLFLFLIFLG
jgi:hypothetical protein